MTREQKTKLTGYCPGCWKYNRATVLLGISNRRCPMCDARLKPPPKEILIRYHEREHEAGENAAFHERALKAIKTPQRTKGVLAT